MKAAIYNPYLDTLGGGERYTTAVIAVLKEMGYDVYVEWKGTSIIKSLEERFNLSLTGINFVNDVKKGDGYDLCFWVSDGSIPLLRSRVNLLHFQIPFHGVGGKSLINKMKLFRISKIIANSFFTKKIVDKEYGVDSVVLHPPVAVDEIKPGRKENIILYVGRFSKLKQSKGQEILIDCFKRLFRSGVNNYRLIIAGGAGVGTGDFLEFLKKKAQGLPIEIVENPSFKALTKLYSKAKIFWSAAGYGINERKNPEAVEHFGITVVEAMAAGVVPLVFNAGGFKEIVNGKFGIIWNKKAELVRETKRLIADKSALLKYSQRCILRSRDFSYQVFSQSFRKLLSP
jgi:glycosyltransferase involved in cell wall biosynthesis